MTFFGYFGWVGARTVVSSITLLSDVCDLIRFFKLPGSLGSKAAFSVNTVPGERDGKRTPLYGANQRDVLPLRNVPRAGNDVQHWLRHRLCIEKTLDQDNINLLECADIIAASDVPIMLVDCSSCLPSVMTTFS